jgi:hypothetical protein
LTAGLQHEEATDQSLIVASPTTNPVSFLQREMESLKRERVRAFKYVCPNQYFWLNVDTYYDVIQAIYSHSIASMRGIDCPFLSDSLEEAEIFYISVP